MDIFGLGAAIPVAGLAHLSRAARMKVRGKTVQAGKTGKIVMGAIMVGVAALILTGVGIPLEPWLVESSPAWLTSLTTRF